MNEDLRAADARKCRKITEFAVVSRPPLHQAAPLSVKERVRIAVNDYPLVKERYSALKKLIQGTRNQQSELGQMKPYDVLRYNCVLQYLGYLVEHKNDKKQKIAESIRIAKAVLGTETEYLGRAIRTWSKLYILSGKVAAHQQGKHSKRKNLLDSEDLKLAITTYIKSLRPQDRKIKDIKAFFEKQISRDTLGVPLKISERTLARYMHKWGYKFRRNTKNVSIFLHLDIVFCSLSEKKFKI